ncbi:MAG: hypothetical protein AAF483_12730 [Planctomycetota bacterium]
MMKELTLEILLGFLLGYLAATTSESALHRFFGHASSKWRRRWRRFPTLFKLVTKLHYGHAVVHHSQTYRESHVKQFQNPEEQSKVDSGLVSRGYESYIRSRYGLVTDFLGIVFFVAPPIACCVLVAFAIYGTASVPFLSAALAPISLAPWLSCQIHPYLHLSAEEAAEKAPLLTVLILATPYGKWVRMHHFVHHRYPRYNFNLLPGGDFLFGCYRRPSPADIEEMRRIGLIDS